MEGHASIEKSDELSEEDFSEEEDSFSLEYWPQRSLSQLESPKKSILKSIDESSERSNKDRGLSFDESNISAKSPVKET